MKETMEIFKDITGYDIKSYFEDFVLLSNTYYPNIVGYYVGQNVDVRDSFGRLDALLKQSEAIEPLFSLKASGFNTLDFWELLDVFTDCQTKLWTINNSSRWLRSAILGRYGNNVILNRVLKTRENFEDVALSLGLDDPQDSWIDIAKNNFVEEEDYTANGGGGMFKINIRQSDNYDVPNIVDNLAVDKILGKDISVAFGFQNNDLMTVEFDAAVRQAFNTILTSLKGTIPEYPEYGFPNDMIGSSMNAIQYPTIFKHLLNMFQRDARWIEVNLIDLYTKDDNVFIKLSARTITNNYLETNVQL